MSCRHLTRRLRAFVLGLVEHSREGTARWPCLRTLRRCKVWAHSGKPQRGRQVSTSGSETCEAYWDGNAWQAGRAPQPQPVAVAEWAWDGDTGTEIYWGADPITEIYQGSTKLWP